MNEPDEPNGPSEAAYQSMMEALRHPHPVPLSRSETDTLREMLEEWRDRRREAERREITAEKWRKRYPILFAAISALLAFATFVANFLVSHRPP